MEWRPEGWKKPFRDNELTGQTCNEIYEAGADAMLEALLAISSGVVKDYVSRNTKEKEDGR